MFLAKGDDWIFAGDQNVETVDGGDGYDRAGADQSDTVQDLLNSIEKII